MPVDHTTAKEIIEAAHKAVVEAGVPEPFQAAAFAKALDILSGGGGAVPPAPLGGEPGGGGGGAPQPPADERAAKIAKRMGLDAPVLAYIYELEDDGVTLVVKRAKLANDKANA